MGQVNTKPINHDIIGKNIIVVRYACCVFEEASWDDKIKECDVIGGKCHITSYDNNKYIVDIKSDKSYFINGNKTELVKIYIQK